MNLKVYSEMRWAYTLTKGYRGALLWYFILEIFGIALSLLFVYWSKEAIDSAMGTSRIELKRLLLLVIASVVVGIAVRSLSAWINERTRLRMGLELQNQMIDNQMLSTWKIVKDWHSGDIQVRINSDCMEVVNVVSYSAISFLLTLIKLIAFFGFLWSMDPMLALVVVSITPLFFFTKLYYNKMRRLSREIKKEESNFGKTLQENLRQRMLIRGMDLLSFRRKKVFENQEDIFDLKIEQLNFSTITQVAMKLTINTGYLVTFVWGVYRLQIGQITFGEMTAFLQLVGRIQSPILALIGFAPIFIRFRTSVERLMELTQGEKEVDLNPIKIQGIRSLIIENLCFRYEDFNVIDKLHLELYRGEQIAIMGSSGRGKTTLIRLLLALLKPDSGTIRLLDASRSYDLSSAHRTNFAYVPQGNTLFSGTIRENLMYSQQSESQARIEYAIWLACAEFIYDLPMGLDTLVGESGYGLSEGQAQRIAIARAMIRESDIWLFDEITSALDEKTAELLMCRLMGEAENKLCLFVTHDIKLAEKCNQIIRLEK